MNRFYIGLHQITDAKHFDRACLSIRRLQDRIKPLRCPDVLVDSAAFTELALYGKYRRSTRSYAKELHRLSTAGVVEITAAVAQDYMCEPFMLKRTGMTVEQHQRKTIKRYDSLVRHLQEMYQGNVPFQVMPVLQGYTTDEYLRHVDMYGDRLKEGMWTGVGSVCKRNSKPSSIAFILTLLKRRRPDLLLHGFGIKLTALKDGLIRSLLESSDSQAWGISANDSNDWREARRYKDRIERIMELPTQKRRLFI